MLSWLAYAALIAGAPKHQAPATRATAKAARLVNDAFDLGGNLLGLGLARDQLFDAIGKTEPQSAAESYWMFLESKRNPLYYVFDGSHRTVAFYWENTDPFGQAQGEEPAYTPPPFLTNRSIFPGRAGTSIRVGFRPEDVSDWRRRYSKAPADSFGPSELPPANRLRSTIALRLAKSPYVLLLEGWIPGANWFVAEHSFDPVTNDARDWSRLRTPEEQKNLGGTFSFAVVRALALPLRAYQAIAKDDGQDGGILWPNLSLSGTARSLCRPQPLSLVFTATSGGQTATWTGSAPSRIDG